MFIVPTDPIRSDEFNPIIYIRVHNGPLRRKEGAKNKWIRL